MDCDDFEKTLKVIVVGNGNVGKTSMTTRYAKGRFTGNYKKTIGVDFMEKTVELRDLGETIKLMIWDTAGQEEFDTLTSRYYKGAGAVIYVFSTVDRASFDDLPKWKRKVEEECGHICHVLVQNKIDLIDDAAMTRDEVEDMADYMNIRLFRSCVQDNVNVKEVFEYLCRRYMKSGGDDLDEPLQAVADISALSEATKQAAASGGAHDRKGRREFSDVSERAPSSASDGRSSSHDEETSPMPTKKPDKNSARYESGRSGSDGGDRGGRHDSRRYDSGRRGNERSDSGRYDNRDRHGNHHRDDDRYDSDRYDNERHSSGSERYDSGRHDSGRHDSGRHDSGRHDSGRYDGGRQEFSRKTAGGKNSRAPLEHESPLPPAPPASIKKDREEHDRHSEGRQESEADEPAQRQPRQPKAPARSQPYTKDRLPPLSKEERARMRKEVLGSAADDDDPQAELSSTLTPSPQPSSAQIVSGKVQPSKRRTNGKKRPSVAECTIS